jgi:pyruvate carboxylase
MPPPGGTAQILAERGPEGLAQWCSTQNTAAAHRHDDARRAPELLATRVRAYDILRIADATAHLAPGLFSLETWGGATFDVAYRFLNEDPWERLRQLKRAVPNLLQQMLLRGANAVGYTSYPDNVVEAFVDEAAEAGSTCSACSTASTTSTTCSSRSSACARPARSPRCRSATRATSPTRRARSTTSTTTPISRKRIEDMGAHILCIKDMAGLLRPHAARLLIEKPCATVKLPIHLHTHDTSGNGIAT